ncbi:MAG: DUF420 domain-containing protein [Akkermansiaceae bacterium]|nr:DUF420 domain-containing protein [Akkermansiaceae bacterium]NNM28688.1 DUF420 domain-containing protein [Akkermansiaceae bacterium]
MADGWQSYHAREANLALAARLKVAVWIVSLVVFGLVGAMRSVKVPLPEGVDLGVLPLVHALLNGSAAAALVGALVAIKARRVDLHRGLVYLAMGLSALFLLSYVTYHFTTPETIFGDRDGDGVLQDAERAAAGSGRTVYLLVLLSHISLAAVSLPFILLTFVYGFTHQPAKHRRLARWVFPVWLYVAITGPVVYLMLRPFY